MPLERYVQTATFRGFILVALALTALFSLLEFVDQLSYVDQGHYRTIDALAYVLLTAPSRLLQVAPVSMLLGCLLALGALARSSELTALGALGISERRVVLSVIKLAVLIMAVLFLMAEFVIPPAQQHAQAERTFALSSSTLPGSGDGIWVHGDHQYLKVQQFDYGNVPKNIDIYAFTADGDLESFIHADRADIRPDGTWLLTGVLRKYVRVSQFETEHLATLSWHSFLPSQLARLLILPPESMPPVALYRYVRDLERQHQEAIRYEQALWAKASIPLSMVAMIMIAIPFVFGPPRSQGTGQQIAIGAVCGITFTLIQHIAGHLDRLLDLNPAVTAFGPPLLLMALAVYLFRRANRWHRRPFTPRYPGH